MEDTICALSRHLKATTFDGLPLEAVERAKMSFLDVVGALVAGATARGCREVVDLVLEWGGKPESTVLMRGGKVPAHNAALANSVMARALDFDDSMYKGLHLSASLVPTAIAVAEKRGKVSGKEMLAAIALGTDIAGRIDYATVDYDGFDPTICCGIFGSTAVAARLLDLNEDQIASAFGIALNQASGTMQSNVDGVLSVRLNQGIAASAGITSALFASRGITGVRQVLDGQWGYFHLFSKDKRVAEHLVDRLGSVFYGNRTQFKRWPSCGSTLSATDAAVELVEQSHVRPDEIEKILVRCGRFVLSLVGHPFEIGDNPEVNAQFSVRYAVANAILRGHPRLEHFGEKLVRDPEVMDLAKRVDTVVDESPQFNQPPFYVGAEVSFILRDGRTLTRYVKAWKGHYTNPLAMDDIVEKFNKNLSYASPWFDTSRGTTILDFVTNLETADDATPLIGALKFDGAVN
ncbi:MAG: MmgE/PrpD family protein [Chloroflexi bacterium]|nr:MmgE/PrpD family protein [Chloroflexota bacterium]